MIKPCPFCGNDQPLGPYETSQEFTSVICTCGSRGPRGFDSTDAVHKWNHRHNEHVDSMLALRDSGE